MHVHKDVFRLHTLPLIIIMRPNIALSDSSKKKKNLKIQNITYLFFGLCHTCVTEQLPQADVIAIAAILL